MNTLFLVNIFTIFFSLAKRKAEEEGHTEDDRPLFGANIPFRNPLREIKATDEEFKYLTRYDPEQNYNLRKEINFAYVESQPSVANKESLYSVSWLEEELSKGKIKFTPRVFRNILLKII